MPPYSHEQGGFVCNIAIDRYATAVVQLQGGDEPRSGATFSDEESALANAALRRALATSLSPNLALRLSSNFPVGAGLGGSSAAGVAALSALLAWHGKTPERAELAELSRRVEVEDLGVPGGRQDHYAASFGGALALSFEADSVAVERIPLSASLRDEISRRFVIVYTGQSRISGDTITAVIDAYRSRDAAVCGSLDNMRRLARFMADALRRGSLDDLGEALREHWLHQRSLHPLITTPQIELIMNTALKSGALGGKALGASGGGCVLLVARSGEEDKLRLALADMGESLAFHVDEAGVVVRGHNG